MTIHITGNDFGLLLPFESIRATDVREAWVCAAGYVGDHFSVYWRDMSANFSEERRLHVDYVPGLHWRVIRFQLSQHPLWHGNIEQIRVDLFNGRAERTEGMGHVRWVRLVC